MDLVRYVEFQNSFSLIKKTHQWWGRCTSTRGYSRLQLPPRVV